MKIKVNYDLLEEAAVAKKGFSVNRCARNAGKRLLFFSAFLTPLYCSGLFSTINIIFSVSYVLFNAFSLDFLPELLCRKSSQLIAVQNLKKLSYQLKNIFVDTDCEKLQDAQQYKTEYDIHFEDSIFPEIMQKKYMMVPVNNDWGNNERSLMQEHIIGSKNYALSYGEPEKNKVLSLIPKKVIQK